MIKVGCITGTGFYSLNGFELSEKKEIKTPFGTAGVEVGKLHGKEVIIISRHGKNHTIAPSDINYRANLYALHMMGVNVVLATSVCGTIDPNRNLGDFIMMDQFLNFSQGRKDTFYPMDGKLAHIDVTYPYCRELKSFISSEAKKMNVSIADGGVYCCFGGPRFETKSEIQMAKILGGTNVGHTNYPECVLARELAMSYATVGVISNYAAGVMPEEEGVAANDLNIILSKLGDTLSNLFAKVIEALPDDFDPKSMHVLDKAFI